MSLTNVQTTELDITGSGAKSVSHDTGGSYNWIVVAMEGGSSDFSATVTYGGQSIAQKATERRSQSYRGDGRIIGFARVASDGSMPAAGSNTFEVTVAGSLNSGKARIWTGLAIDPSVVFDSAGQTILGTATSNIDCGASGIAFTAVNSQYSSIHSGVGPCTLDISAVTHTNGLSTNYGVVARSDIVSGTVSVSTSGTASSNLLVGIVDHDPTPDVDVETGPYEDFTDQTWTHTPGANAKGLITFHGRSGKNNDGSQTYGGKAVPVLVDGYQETWGESDGYNAIRGVLNISGRGDDSIVHDGSDGGNTVYAMSVKHPEKKLKVVGTAVDAGDGTDLQMGETMDPSGSDSIALVFTVNNTLGTVTGVNVNGRAGTKKWESDVNGKRMSVFVHKLLATDGPRFIGVQVSAAAKAITTVVVVGTRKSGRDQTIVIT